MPREYQVDRPTKITLKLPESVRDRLYLFLYSEVEERIPQGAIQEFFMAQIREYFDHRSIDLATLVPGVPSGVFAVSGTAASLKVLIDHLNKDNV